MVVKQGYHQYIQLHVFEISEFCGFTIIRSGSSISQRLWEKKRQRARHLARNDGMPVHMSPLAWRRMRLPLPVDTLRKVSTVGIPTAAAFLPGSDRPTFLRALAFGLAISIDVALTFLQAQGLQAKSMKLRSRSSHCAAHVILHDKP